jgi:pimeloyl-ACP methyl ester carboxylesterase
MSISAHTMTLDDGTLTHVRVPDGAQDGAPIVFVHGIGREAERLAEQWAPLLKRLGRVGLFPLLDEALYPEYQLLHGDDGRSRSLLTRLLAAAAARLGTDPRRCDLGGFSAGAQFTHRALLFDLGIEIPRAMVISPGTYCFPTNEHAYPFGLRPESEGATPPSFERLIRSRLLVAVGALDAGTPKTAPEMALLQGATRVERGANWSAAVRGFAQEDGLTAQLAFDTIPNAEHNFGQCLDQGLADLLVAFLSGD